MQCPVCNHNESIVKDSRNSDDGSSIRRRRECSSCELRFTTYEKIHLRDIFVMKKSGDKEFFDRGKLKSSIKMSLRKRKVNIQIIEDIVARIVQKLYQLNDAELHSHEIGELVMDHLKGVDKVAYVRFASVYKNFNSTEDFAEFLSNIS
jgi:transcriptional repressor NrdR